jgi:hypothetical protein
LDAEVQLEGSGVGSGGATTGVGTGGVATRVGTGGAVTGAGAVREPLANTTVGQLIQLVAAQSEHMARLERQVERVADGLERQVERVVDSLERQMVQIGDQLERMAGVMERAEGWE